MNKIRQNNIFKMSEYLISLAVLSLFYVAETYSAVTVKEAPGREGVMTLTVKNSCFEIDIVPGKGARAVSFKTRYSDRDWCWAGGGLTDCGELFMDNFLGQGSPMGELCFIRHDYEIIQKGPETVEIKCHVITKEKLRFEKTFIFMNDSPVVRVKLSLTNESKDVVTRGLWPKMSLWMAGIKEENKYYRPYQHGVMTTGWDAAEKANKGDDWLRLPHSGWTAGINEKQGEGLVFLMDYNWLRILYNCHSAWTIEWFYDDLPIPPEKKWGTEYQMILIKGFSSVVHASENIIAGMTMEAKKKFDLVHPDNPNRPEFLQISHALSRSISGNLSNVKISGSLKEVDTGASHDLPVVEIGKLDWEVKTAPHDVNVNCDVRVLAEMTLTALAEDGQEVKEQYVYYWPGISGEKFNLVAGEIKPTYSRQSPPKKKQYPKPEDMKYTLNTPIKLLEFRGLGYFKMGVTKAAAKAGVRNVAGEYFSKTWSGSKLTSLPTTYKEMFANGVVVLNGVDAQSLTDFGLEMLSDLVKSGGSLLVIGGLFAYDAGGYQGTRLEEMLPVKLSGKIPGHEQFNPPVVLKTAATARCLKGAKWGGKPLCYWWQPAVPKEGSWVEITAGNEPFLVCWPYGKGRVAAILGGPCGDPQPGQVPFWEDKNWTENLSCVIKWLVFGEGEIKNGK
ncbi:MAG: hypothetical protein L6437_12730 [Kiritimatiellae bacterium]|nr:hypothetical protein [Kiritimatiellia bacterium]